MEETKEPKLIGHYAYMKRLQRRNRNLIDFVILLTSADDSACKHCAPPGNCLREVGRSNALARTLNVVRSSPVGGIDHR